MSLSKYALKLSKNLFAESEEADRFLKAIELEESDAEKALYWLTDPKWGEVSEVFPDWVRVTQKSKDPGKHPDFENGEYYVADISSALEGMVFSEIDPPSVVIDVCAAPGGKSVFASRLFSPKILISNDSIEKRVKALISNFSRCKIQNSIITCSEAYYLTKSLTKCADLVIVDAPCSGQSLPAKGVNADNPFHPVVVNKCVRRQRKILADAQSLVAGGGYLAYMTCTFSKEENEEMLEWFLREFTEFSPVIVHNLKLHQSKYSKIPCYRFFPHNPKEGAGGFAALFKKSGDVRQNIKDSELRIFWRSDRAKG